MTATCTVDFEIPVPAGSPITLTVPTEIPDTVTPTSAQIQVKETRGAASFLVDLAAATITEQGRRPRKDHKLWDLAFDLAEADTRAIGIVRRPYHVWVNTEDKVVQAGTIRCCQAEL